MLEEGSELGAFDLLKLHEEAEQATTHPSQES